MDTSCAKDSRSTKSANRPAQSTSVCLARLIKSKQHRNPDCLAVRTCSDAGEYSSVQRRFELMANGR